MKIHRYKLEPYKGNKSRFKCPKCNQKEFVRYIDRITKSYIDNDVGRCNRLDQCGYVKLPPLETKCYNVPFVSIEAYNDKTYRILSIDKKVYFLPISQTLELLKSSCYVGEWYLLNTNKPPFYFIGDIKYFSEGKFINIENSIINIEPPKTIYKVNKQVVEESMIDFDNNNFALILANLFGYEEAGRLISKYCIGTSHYCKGAVLFWQISIEEEVRTAKIMEYDINTMKRTSNINWFHVGKIKESEELKQCFFGEHLLFDETKPVGIVEAEKTAIICSYFYPEYTWLSAGSMEGLSYEKFKVLKNRDVTLFPDLGKATEKWKQKAKEFSHIAKISVSEYLTNIASTEEVQNGYDLADYLINSIRKAS